MLYKEAKSSGYRDFALLEEFQFIVLIIVVLTLHRMDVD